MYRLIHAFFYKDVQMLTLKLMYKYNVHDQFIHQYTMFDKITISKYFCHIDFEQKNLG